MAADLKQMRAFLGSYDGPKVRIMEVCGSHTAAISRLGIPSLLSPGIELISGPGCPVCVTPTAYLDRLIELSLTPGICVCTFGDLIRVPGSRSSLSRAREAGARIQMVYSPMDTLKFAAQEPETTFVFAAVGFETTTPAYALLMQRLEEAQIRNVKLLTAIKTMPAVIDALCASGAKIDAFLAPGHVSVVTGSEVFRPLAEKYSLPFVVAGFQGPQLLAAIYGAVRSVGTGRVLNLYPSVVKAEGNPEAQRLVARYFEPSTAVWRGLGAVPGSGLYLRREYACWDAGSAGLNEDNGNPACSCGKVLSGLLHPHECPLFGSVCTPEHPQGACMVSLEGSCYQHWMNPSP